jgi:hypothetical protein
MILNNFRTFLLMIIASVITLSYTGCKKDEDTYSLYVLNSNLNFGYDENRMDVSFSNISDNTIEWTATSPENFITFDQDRGSLSKGISNTLQIIVNRELISSDSIETEVLIHSSLGDKVTLNITVLNYPENKIRLSYNVKDAAYCNKYEKLYILPYNSSSSSNFLDIYNPINGSFEQIEFQNNVGFDKVVVSYDDNYLGLYGGNYLFVVDLATNSIVEELYLGYSVSSIVFAPNNKLYIFPNNNSNYDMHCYNMTTNEMQEFDFPQFYRDDIIGKLHPSGKYIYAVDDDYSEYLIKISLDGTTPNVVYSENMEGFDDNIWFSDNGIMVFSVTNKYCIINPDMAGNDVVGNSSFEFNYYRIQDLEFNGKTNDYYIVPTYSSYDFTDRVLVYDELLNYKKMINSEDFIYKQYGNDTYSYVKAMVTNVYVIESNGGIILITKPDGYSSNVTAIEVISRDDL